MSDVEQPIIIIFATGESLAEQLVVVNPDFSSLVERDDISLRNGCVEL